MVRLQPPQNKVYKFYAIRIISQRYTSSTLKIYDPNLEIWK